MADGKLSDAGLNPVMLRTDAVPCAFTSTIRLLTVSAMKTSPAGSTTKSAGELRVMLPPVLSARTRPRNNRLAEAWANCVAPNRKRQTRMAASLHDRKQKTIEHPLETY